MPKVRISSVWQHYDVNEECENFAICRYCGNNISRGGMSSNLKGNNTTNLWTHLRHKHSDEVVVSPIQSQKPRTPVTIKKEKTVRITKAKQSLPSLRVAKPKVSLEANTSSASDVGTLPQKWEDYDQGDEIGDIKDIIYNEDPLCYSPIQVVEEEMIDTSEKVTTVLNPTSSISRSQSASASVTPMVTTMVSTSSSNSAKSLKNNLEQSIDRLTSVSEQLTYIIQQNNDEHSKDDDYYFALSLVPIMRQLSLNRKLYVRSKIQEILFKESEANPSTKQE
ncbi:uncharacterized protein Dwil_GK22912, isoform A [Drosophila willistoni]|uniref:Uncharacterized protein, isoform A n=1 Tax=Drosophila willistoni TaxID=7260 RepID=B4NND3_DROWI|nr:uncharacterized protein LOC6652283 isoform X2 [Drosophila willistoni]EDW85872.1 uncharacterized protein Dwil_GK22912, isoform A [Drosophila willistoni]